MKAGRFCKVENMTPEEAIKTINECSWESAAAVLGSENHPRQG